MLKDLFANTLVNIDEMLRHLRKTASELGLPFGERTKTYNSRLAQELGLWAVDNDKGDQFHKAAFKAYFVNGENIAKIPVLLDLAASVGLSTKEAESVLEERTYQAAVDADWKLSWEKGITAVPTFLIQQDKLVGAQPYEMLVELLEKKGLKKKGIQDEGMPEGRVQ